MLGHAEREDGLVSVRVSVVARGRGLRESASTMCAVRGVVVSLSVWSDNPNLRNARISSKGRHGTVQLTLWHACSTKQTQPLIASHVHLEEGTIGMLEAETGTLLPIFKLDLLASVAFDGRCSLAQNAEA